MLSKDTTINFFCHVYLPATGGIERYTKNFSEELATKGYKVNIITTNSHNLGQLSNQGRVDIFRLQNLKLVGGRFPVPFNIFEFVKLYRLFFKDKNSLVILNSRLFLTSMLGLFLAKISGAKTLLIEHGSGHLEYSNKLFTKIFTAYEHFVSIIYRFSGIKFYGVSKASSDWLAHFGIGSDGQIYNGVSELSEVKESSKFDSSFKNKKIITYVGRMIPEKGVGELFEAFEKFANQNSDYILVMVGEGPLFDKYRVISQSRDDIIITGGISHEEVLGILSRTDIFVNPSNYVEGLPTTILEAGLRGVTVISTPNGGAKEVILNDGTGYLISGGEPKYILNALVDASNNPVKAKKMGKNLQNVIQKNFLWSSIVDKFLGGFQ
jgi:glycosyltransferase involved in cell wall biosynthesis